MSDKNWSPWPDPGKSLYFTWRMATFVSASPMYSPWNQPRKTLTDLRWFVMARLPLPHFSFVTKWLHGTVGYQPINLLDPAFFWRERPDVQKRIQGGENFVEWSVRFGLGTIS